MLSAGRCSYELNLGDRGNVNGADRVPELISRVLSGVPDPQCNQVICDGNLEALEGRNRTCVKMIEVGYDCQIAYV
jgi:hypothetical protein